MSDDELREVGRFEADILRLTGSERHVLRKLDLLHPAAESALNRSIRCILQLSGYAESCFIVLR